MEPHAIVCTNIDPGKHAGVALFVRGEMKAHREVRDGVKAALVRREVMEAGQALALALDLPHVVVIERHAPGAGGRGFFTAASRDGLAARAGAWKEAALLAGVHPKRIVRVYPHVWRAPVLGRGTGKREHMAALAKTYVETRFGIVVTDDVAVAICMGIWSATAPEVAKALGTGRAKK